MGRHSARTTRFTPSGDRRLRSTLVIHFPFPDMSTILQELETRIAGLKSTVAKSNVGVVREIGDGAAKVEGLSDVMLNEMIEFPRRPLRPRAQPRRNRSRLRAARRRREHQGGRRSQDHRPAALAFRSARACSAAWSILSASRSTARARSRPTRTIRSRKSLPASSRGSRCPCRCRRASCRSTR